MKRVVGPVFLVTILALSLVSRLPRGSGRRAAPARRRRSADPRVGLKAGLRDAGKAARNMELVAALPKPPGFFDPKAPAGEPTPAEREPTRTSQARSRREPPASDAGAAARAA